MQGRSDSRSTPTASWHRRPGGNLWTAVAVTLVSPCPNARNQNASCLGTGKCSTAKISKRKKIVHGRAEKHRREHAASQPSSKLAHSSHLDFARHPPLSKWRRRQTLGRSPIGSRCPGSRAFSWLRCRMLRLPLARSRGAAGCTPPALCEASQSFFSSLLAWFVCASDSVLQSCKENRGFPGVRFRWRRYTSTYHYWTFVSWLAPTSHIGTPLP